MPNRLLDASALAPRERDTATREFLETLTEVDVMGHDCPAGSIRTRIHGWDLGTFQLTFMDGPWLRFGLNRRSTTEAVSFGIQLSGQTMKTIGDHRQVFAAGEMSLTDFSSPFLWHSAEASTSLSIRFSYAGLCLPAEEIRSAVGDLASSPLYGLFQAHVRQLYRFIEEDITASAVESLGAATLELARAVIATAGHDDLTRNDVANEALVTRVEAYVRQHLADPALSPESIARAHNVSVRQLYKLWSARELGLAEWIMRGRLEGARRDIAKDGSAGIAAVARRWGFTDSTHFGRRFRAAYGISPREWRQVHESQQPPRASALGKIMLLLDTSADAACRQLADEHADATLMVNAAGLFLPKPFLDHDGADYDVYQELNRAIFFLTQTVARGMVSRGRGGSIVNVGSMWAHQATGRRRRRPTRWPRADPTP